jgi:hypothetical protein
MPHGRDGRATVSWSDPTLPPALRTDSRVGHRGVLKNPRVDVCAVRCAEIASLRSQ